MAETLKQALIKRLTKFNGKPWNKMLQKEVRQEVLIFLAEKGLYPRHLGIAIGDDGFIEIDASDYVPLSEAAN